MGFWAKAAVVCRQPLWQDADRVRRRMDSALRCGAAGLGWGVGRKMAAIEGAAANLALWGLAAAGLVLGALGAGLGLRRRDRCRSLEEQLARLEEAARAAREREAKRARLSAAIVQEVTVRSYLSIRNYGHGAARDITVSIDGAALDRCPLIDPDDLERARAGAVGAHATLKIPLRPGAEPAKLQLELTWSDGSGELGFYEAELTR